MLMTMPDVDRFVFLEKVTKGQMPRYRQTQPGKPDVQAHLKQTLPIIATQHAIHDRQSVCEAPSYSSEACWDGVKLEREEKLDLPF